LKERDTSGRGVLLPEPDSPRLRSEGWMPCEELAEVVEALWFASWSMWAAISEVDASELTDRRVPLREVTGIDPAAVEERLRALPSGGDPKAIGPGVEKLLGGVVRSVDAAVTRAAGWVEMVERPPAITTVDQLVARAGVQKRSVQRAFRRYVGVPPKWMIRRFRLHEAIERVGKGEYEGFAQLAAELGYADQAHFSRDFVEATGHTPKAYAVASS